MQFSQEFKDQVINATDIVDLISENVQLESKGSNYFGLCPFHNDTSPSMSVSPSKQIYKCFSCGASGNVVTFHMDYNGLSFPEALVELASRANIGLPSDYTSYSRPKVINPMVKSSHEINVITSKLFNHFLKTTDDGIEARKYLLNRGFSDEAIKKYMIGYIPRSHNDVFNFLKQKGYSEEQIIASGIALVNDSGYIDRFRSRIMFPLYDDESNIVGFSGRVVGQGEPKYMNSPETVVFNKSNLLFNFNNAKQVIRKEKHAILMEGFMDVIKADIFGIENCVAAMGTAFTDEQARKLRRVTDTIYICFDGDKAGQNAALSSIKILRNFNFKIKVINLKDNLDPDDFLSKYGKDLFLEAINSAKNIVEFQINKLYKEADLSSEETKANFLRETFNVIRTVGDEVAENLYLSKVAKILSLDVNFVVSSYKKNKPKIEIKKIVEEKPKVETKMYTASERAEQFILKAMTISKSYALKYEKVLGFLPTEKYNVLAYYIISYYNKHDEITEAKFINSLEDHKDVIDSFTWIVDNVKSIFINEESIDECIELINNYMIHSKVKELSTQMMNTLDEDEKNRYYTKILELQRKIK